MHRQWRYGKNISICEALASLDALYPPRREGKITFQSSRLSQASTGKPLTNIRVSGDFNPRGRISLDSKTIQNNQLNPSYIVFIIQPIKRVVIIILLYILIILHFFHFTGANLPEKICSLMIRTSIFKEVCIVSTAKKGSFNYGFNASPPQHRF